MVKPMINLPFGDALYHDGDDLGLVYDILGVS